MGRRRGLTLVETLVGALVLAVCAAPLLGCVSWMRGCAADATTDALVASALEEQIGLARNDGRASALTPGTTTLNKSLSYGVTLAIVRTVASVNGRMRLYDVKVVGTWTSRRGVGRTLTLETHVFSPND